MLILGLFDIIFVEQTHICSVRIDQEAINMALPARQEYEAERRNNQSDVRNMVLQAVEQVKQGKTKDFNEVCDRLEKKYTRV